MGDPLGVGPEIVVRALADKDVRDVCVPLAVGNRGVFDRAAALQGRNCPVSPVPYRLSPGSTRSTA